MITSQHSHVRPPELSEEWIKYRIQIIYNFVHENRPPIAMETIFIHSDDIESSLRFFRKEFGLDENRFTLKADPVREFLSHGDERDYNYYGHIWPDQGQIFRQGTLPKIFQ